VDADREAQLKQEMEGIQRKLKEAEQRVKANDADLVMAKQLTIEKERAIVS
jgi:hypothetical protein